MTDIKRTLFICIDDGSGVREVWEPSQEELLAMGYAFVGETVIERIDVTVEHEAGGHPIPDLEAPKSILPSESAIPRDVLIGHTEHGDRVYAAYRPLFDLVKESRAQMYAPGNVRNNGDEAYELVRCLIRVLDDERLGRG